MALSVLTAFWAVSMLFVITPGADWAYAISAGMRGRWVMPAVAGMLSGHFLATLVVAAGVGSLLAGHPLALTLLTLAGCSYLLWLCGFWHGARPGCALKCCEFIRGFACRLYRPQRIWPAIKPRATVIIATPDTRPTSLAAPGRVLNTALAP